MSSYLLKSKPVEYSLNSDDNHVLVHTKTSRHDYCLAINIKSNIEVSHLHYCIKKYKSHPSFIPKTEDGLFLMKKSIHYFKDKLVKKEDFVCSDEEIEGLVEYIKTCSNIIAIGDVWKNEDKKNIPFGFYPDKGMHDIHANGNLDDGLLCFEYKEKYIVIFMYFEKD